MSELAVKVTLDSDVAPGGTFTVTYPSGYSQSDFLANDAKTSVYGADHDDLPVTLNASDATVTWPAAKSTTLSAGTELTIGLDLKNKVEAGAIYNLLPHQADSSAASGITDNSGGTADTTVEAVSGSGADAAINNNFAGLVAQMQALETEYNNLLAKLQDAGVMESS